MKPIAATKKIIEVPLSHGGSVRVRSLGRFDAARLIGSASENQQSETVASLALMAAAIVGTIGLKHLDRIKPKRDPLTRVEMIPDEVLEHVCEDVEACNAIVLHALSGIITEDDLPNFGRQDAGSGDAPSGLPQNESAPQAPASSSPPPAQSSVSRARHAQPDQMTARSAEVSGGFLPIPGA